jgi:hypothetical protein
VLVVRDNVFDLHKTCPYLSAGHAGRDLSWVSNCFSIMTRLQCERIFQHLKSLLKFGGGSNMAVSNKLGVY